MHARVEGIAEAAPSSSTRRGGGPPGDACRSREKDHRRPGFHEERGRRETIRIWRRGWAEREGEGAGRGGEEEPKARKYILD
ncbi:hypothetical protein PUN28_013381 [Cardiocondyla obscurior]|uniref:Histone H3 n=1 Tax=Cardiocondyla obscurior TaxID=286306 RepID=A0AAW2F862_9HYME